MWEVGESLGAVKNRNLTTLMRHGAASGTSILPEIADAMLEELRFMAREAGVARWDPDPDEKIVRRDEVLEWWQRWKNQIEDDSDSMAGDKLRGKLRDAELEELEDMASELRRDYAAVMRNSEYMENEYREQLQRRVKADMNSLRSGLMSGEIEMSGPEFHNLCIETLKLIEKESDVQAVDLGAFLQGCMYEITDRCLHKFVRPS